MYDDSCQYPARPLCRTRKDFEANIFSEPVMRPSYYIYVAKIEDTTLFSYEDMFIAKDYCLNDRKKGINKNPFYISTNIP